MPGLAYSPGYSKLVYCARIYLPKASSGTARTKIYDSFATGSDGAESSKRSYSLLGITVGRSCLCAALGIGNGRLHKAASGVVDARFSCNVPLHRAKHKARSADNFFLRLHGTVAEILPTGPWPQEILSSSYVS